MDDPTDIVEKMLENEFQSVGKKIGAVFSIPQQECSRYIDRCRELGCVITYLEAFHIFGERIQPDMQYNFENYDSDDVLFGPGWEEAKEHIKKHFDKNLHYEIGIEKIEPSA